MNAHVFNGTLLVGWVLVLVGCCLISVAVGLAIAGLLLIFLTLYVAGKVGVFMPKKNSAGEAEEA